MCTIEHLETLRESRDRELSAIRSYCMQIDDLTRRSHYSLTHPRVRSLYRHLSSARRRLSKHQHAIDLQLLEVTT